MLLRSTSHAQDRITSCTRHNYVKQYGTLTSGGELDVGDASISCSAMQSSDVNRLRH
jgi:hypothetical protein